MTVSMEELLRAVNHSRDSITGQMGGLRSAVDHIAEELERHNQRITALEQAQMEDTPYSRPVTLPPEVNDMIQAVRRDVAQREARSQMKLEAEAAEAQEHVRAAHRRKFITWILGTLFVAAQTAQLVRTFWN